MARHRWDPVVAPPPGLFRPVPVDPAGLQGPTRWQAARGLEWVRTSRGLFVPSYVDRGLPEQRILEQSARSPRGAVVTGWSGCRLHGAAFFDGLSVPDLAPVPVVINVGPRGYLAGDAEVLVRYGRLEPADLMVRQGIQTVSATRAAYDAMRLTGDEREAVVALDMMAAAGLVSIAMMWSYALPRATAREPFLLRAVQRASEHSRSPMETRLRLICVLDAGLPAPLVNCDVLDLEGRLLGEVDLLDASAGVAFEYDGDEHRGPIRRQHDLAKQDRLESVGLVVARVTGRDMREPQLVVRRLLAARARAASRPAAERRWVARPRASVLHARIEERLAQQTWYESLDTDPHRAG